MKNIVKIMFVIFSALSFSVAQAGEFTVTGNVKASMSMSASDGSAATLERGRALGISNAFTLGASGELDNGLTWKYAQDIDAATVQDDAKLTLSGGFGTVGIFVSEGGLDADNAASQSVISRPSDTSFAEAMFDSFDLAATSTLQVHTPAGLLPFGTVVKVAYAPANDTSAVNDYKATGATNSGGFTASSAANVAQTQDARMGRSATHWRVNTAPIDGLVIGADYVDFNDVTGAIAQSPESGSIYATYAYGPATFGYSKNYTAFAIAAPGGLDLTESLKGRKYSVAVNINDNLSVSYEDENSNPNTMTAATSTNTMTAKGIQAAYTMGGMTLAIARNSFDNASYTSNNHVNDTVLSVAMAF